jgi:pimeloyl-ACP methyl ester carboxylesterase
MKGITFNLLIIIGLMSCQKEKITQGANAHDVFFLQEDGISLPIQVHGNVASKKMLVMVHGGPGGNAISYRDDYMIANVETEFAVAYWDQRLAGSSQGNSPDFELKDYRSDVKKVLQLLKTRYGSGTKFYLMGHSWGGFLTPYFLEDGDNQDIVRGWIQVDGAHNYAKNDSLTREMLLLFGKREITANRNTTKWQEIVDYCNAHNFDESADVVFKLNRFASDAENDIAEIKKPTESAVQILLKNRIAITAQISNGIVSALLKKIDRQTYAVPISENLYQIKIPTLLLWGRYDFVCPIGLKDDIKMRIGSSDVSEVTFEQSGHSPMANEPKAFWTEVVDWVKVH